MVTLTKKQLNDLYNKHGADTILVFSGVSGKDFDDTWNSFKPLTSFPYPSRTYKRESEMAINMHGYAEGRLKFAAKSFYVADSKYRNYKFIEVGVVSKEKKAIAFAAKIKSTC